MILSNCFNLVTSQWPIGDLIASFSDITKFVLIGDNLAQE